MTPRLSAIILWGTMAALAMAVLTLLVRNLLAIPVLTPLDPNEGWNAAHALTLAARHALYPPPQSLMVNNYPPLSFYLIGAMVRHGGDAIVIGRWISLFSFFCVGGGIAAVLRRMECDTPAAAFGALFFAAVLLIASDYVGMDDPQLLGHAVQIAALLLLLRGGSLPAALLFAVSLFIKHNLLAMPLASAAWLVWQDRRAGLTFLLWGMAFVLSGLVIFQLSFSASLLEQLTSPRLSSLANLTAAATHLWWAVLPAAAMIWLWPDRSSVYCGLYAITSLLLGLIFAAGDGVDANVFFDLAIALALGLGLTVERSRWPVAAAALPLVVFLAFNFHDNNFFFTRDFRAQSARDIAFLKAQPGPVLCDQLSLCLWAGKGAELDVFNVGEQIKTGNRDPLALVHMIAAHQFAVLQLQDLDALGPQAGAAIRKYYRSDHTDDNGNFLVPVPR
jgi:hypothetical protein